MGIEALLVDLVENIRTHGPRIRLALTASEYAELREHLLRRNGKFYNWFRAIAMVIEEDPLNRPLTVEFASDEDR